MFKRSLSVLVFALVIGSAAGADVRICTLSNGAVVTADNSGQRPVSAFFQACIGDLSVKVIDLQPGTYLVDAPIVVDRSQLTIRTAGLAGDIRNCQQLPAGSCAKFLASPSNGHCINNPYFCNGRPSNKEGMLQARSPVGTIIHSVVFDHLILDGNRDNRQATNAKQSCMAGLNRFGFNSRMAECGDGDPNRKCQFTYNFTRRALCGTGLEFGGRHGRIQGNAAFDNGVHEANLWADGLTIAHNDYGIVNDNHLYNNTDVGLIVGGMKYGFIQSNWIQQKYGVLAFAGMMLGNFAEANATQHQPGDYTGTYIRYNTIQCFGFNCGIGLNMGPDPWVADNRDNIRGGTVTQNHISDAVVQINFGGAGEPATRTKVTNNTLSGAPTTDYKPLLPGSPCRARSGALQNLPNNNTSGVCGNFADADPVATSYECFQACWSTEHQ
jgi:hypothetical protein